MRPQLSPYYGEDYPTPSDQKHMVTPNFERLAKESVVFTRAFAQYSLCGPSRTSILTGRRPDSTRVFTNRHYWRLVGGNFTTLPQVFKDDGYVTIGSGKVFHPRTSSNNSDPISWSEPFFSKYYDGVYEDASRLPTWHAVTEQQVSDIPLTDQFALNHTLNRLRVHAAEARTGKRPFFVSIGFRKPHISLNCPKEYYDLYRLEGEAQYLSNRSWQTPSLAFAMVNTTKVDGVLRLSDAELRRLRRGYFACITYVDHLLGQLLDEVERLGLANDTIIVFIADHGYHLGENGHWGKHVVHELANHVPFMIKIPGRTQPGYRTRSIVQTLDLFPTLVELAGIGGVPKCPRVSSGVPLCTEGISLVPLVDDPSGEVREFALSQVMKGYGYMEYTIRTDRYRYAEVAAITYNKQDDGTYTITPSWGITNDEWLLYDHKNDPEETRNLAYDPQYIGTVTALRKKLTANVVTVYKIPTAL
ncbi:hypothetical protein LSH36_13g25070 [Paralvinella palmiformis]|uniref:Sulfatase N-terminal domain-containing protein n=1 Tax=Paralvinella palmiformis TaxID=53620 RepID=A0AAD9NJ15_9ANNE|nr:hypothetical protein LSH36_13g25070 [Paralvinella palmiformis]